jgi:predicted nucleic acid-binding protein
MRLSIFAFIDILGIDKDLILNALYSDWKDFEDAVQAQAAVENELDVIITRNTKDFKQNTTVRILTPDEFVEVVS